MWRETGESSVERHSKCVSSPLIPLTGAVFLHDRCDMHFSFNMSLSPWGFFPHSMFLCCQPGQYERLAQEERQQKKKGKPASAVCNAICCFRWRRVSKWESCEVSGFLIPQPNSSECENNRHRHESASENTHGSQITPGQMGRVKWAGQKGCGGGGWAWCLCH